MSRMLAPGQAAAQLNGWTHTNDKTIEKTYTFADYHEAANFINRYTDYCACMNFTPDWSNVYNRVSVRISSAEFKAITSKEVDLANHLDRVSRVTLHKDIDDVMRFEDICGQAKIEARSFVNDQTKLTSLFVGDDAASKREQLLLH